MLCLFITSSNVFIQVYYGDKVGWFEALLQKAKLLVFRVNDFNNNPTGWIITFSR